MKKLTKLILVSMLCLSSTNFTTLSAKAYEDGNEYVEIHQGNEEEQKKNEENLLKNIEKSHNMENVPKPRGWGDTIRPAIVPVKQQ